MIDGIILQYATMISIPYLLTMVLEYVHPNICPKRPKSPSHVGRALPAPWSIWVLKSPTAWSTGQPPAFWAN